MLAQTQYRSKNAHAGVSYTLSKATSNNEGTIFGGSNVGGAIKPTAKLQDLGTYLDASGQPIRLQDLVKGLPPSTSLGGLLATILTRAAYDWEGLPLSAFPLRAPGATVVGLGSCAVAAIAY